MWESGEDLGMMQTSSKQEHSKYFLYLGSYGDGIHAFEYEPTGPKLSSLGRTAEMTNPSFLASDPGKRFLYAVGELEGDAPGTVGAFDIDRRSGKLKQLSMTSSGGMAPCHLQVDHTSRLLLVANYTSGSVSAFPIEKNGSLGPMCALLPMEGSSVNPKRQESPHAHQTVVSSDNRYVYVPDLGSDLVRLYSINPERRTVTVHDPAGVKVSPGLGPRHIAFSPDSRYGYLLNEIKSVVTVFQHDTGSGMLRPIQALSSLPEGVGDQEGAAEILVHQTGKFVYASNRGPGSIAVFNVDDKSGMLTQTQMAQTGGTAPRGVEIDPTGQFLFAGDQKANHFVVFRIDQNTGALTKTGGTFESPSPVSFSFIPAA
jgi:6-phosphogluconolactonase